MFVPYLNKTNSKALEYLKDNYKEILEYYKQTKPDMFRMLVGWSTVTQWSKDEPGSNPYFNRAGEIANEEGSTILTLSYSVVKPNEKTRMHTHTHTNPMFKRLHLALDSNDQAYLLVFSQKTPWIVGEIMVFENPNSSHKPVNEGSTDRVVLIIDFHETPITDKDWAVYYSEIVGTRESDIRLLHSDFDDLMNK